MAFRTSLLCCVIGLVGCEVAEPPATDVARKSACDDPVFCGTNSPIFAIYRSFDFNLDGLPNAQGISVLGMSKELDFYRLEVIDSHIRGTDIDGKVLDGTNLIGAKIWLELPTLEQAAITIADVGQYPEVVGNHLLLETYVLQWAEVFGRPVQGPMVPGGTFLDGNQPGEAPPSYVCQEVKDENGEELGLHMFESTVFEGDRFDPETKTVEDKANDRWFNVGCGKHILAKLRLTRNTMHTTKTFKNVQAAVKMFSADYCGTGQPFTLPGVKIAARDRGLMGYARQPTDIEARWSENGAFCLEEPRLVDRADVACQSLPWSTPKDTGPSIEWPIGGDYLPTNPRYGGIPRCSDLDPYSWQSAEELVTSAHY